MAGIDHKELSDPRRHIVIQGDRTARLLDFETAGLGGRRRNVNSLLQFLTLSEPFGTIVMSRLGGDRDDALAALKAYRRRPDDDSYALVLDAMKLTSGEWKGSKPKA